MITVIHHGDLSMLEKLKLHDPFFFGTLPCWLDRVMPKLPPETVRTVTVEQLKEKENQLMAIRTVTADMQKSNPKLVPDRFVKRGVVSTKDDYSNILNWLNSPDRKPGDACVVDMDAAAWEGVPKPETALGYSLRRHFEKGGLSFTAYQSGKLQVTVRRMTPLEIKQREQGRKTAKK